jgi:hypothetical protein
MYNITARASGGNEDHMAVYFPLLMGKVPLLWLDNFLVECITTRTTLSWLFTTNYQATYNHRGNTHHLARVRMRKDETLCEYTNCYFEHCNTLAGVKDEYVIAYYKKGVTNLKLFEKIHEADANTIADLRAYVDKLVDTQDAVVHNFKGQDHDDGGSRSCKRSGEVNASDPPRPSTFLEDDFNMVMDHQCKFHCDARHTMRECEQLKRALGVPSEPKKTNSGNNDEQNSSRHYDNRNRRPDRRNYHDRRPYHRNEDRDRRDYHCDIAAMIATMIDVTTIAAKITRRTTTTTTVMNTATTGMMIVAITTITTITTTVVRSLLLYHHQKAAIPMARSRTPTDKPTSSSAAVKKLKATGSSDQTQGISAKSTLKLDNPYVGWSTPSLSQRKTIGCTYQTPRPTRWSSTP